MKTLQVSMKNRVGCTLRGIVTLPETNEPVPFVLNLHGFAGSASGYKYLHTHMARMLADHGVGCARFDFYGCGESDGEFSDMTFDIRLGACTALCGFTACIPFRAEHGRLCGGQHRAASAAARADSDVPGRGHVVWLCPAGR